MWSLMNFNCFTFDSPFAKLCIREGTSRGLATLLRGITVSILDGPAFRFDAMSGFIDSKLKFDLPREDCAVQITLTPNGCDPDGS